jgi:branched-chain amino acid transport system substrate-binding protein
MTKMHGGSRSRRAAWRRPRWLSGPAAAALPTAACLPAVATGCGSSGGSAAVGSASSTPAASSLLGTPDRATGTPITVGWTNLQGGQTGSQPEFTDTAQATVDYINNYLDGIGGRPLQLSTCFDTADGVSDTACANKFVGEHVPAVLVGLVSDADHYVPTLKAAGIPWVNIGGTTASEFSDQNSFLITGGLVSELGAMAEYLKARKITNIDIFVINLAAATSSFSGIGKVIFQKAGVTFHLVPIPPETADATPQVTAALAASPAPQGFVVIGDQPTCEGILGPLHTANVTSKPVLVGTDCATPTVLKALPVATNGELVALTDELSGPDYQRYLAVLQKYDPNASADAASGLSGYQLVLAFANAMNKAKLSAATPAAVTSALRAAKQVTLPLLPDATFSCDGTAIPVLPTVCSGAAVLATVSNGTFTDYTTYDAAQLFR